MTNAGLCRLLAGGDGRVDRASNDARIALFRIAYLPGFVNFFAGKSDVGGGCYKTVPDWNGFWSAVRCDFAPVLRGVVFVGKAALRGGFNFQRVRLHPKCSRPRQRKAGGGHN